MYDAAHLGHGRTYTLFDAMVRVMRTVFNKQVVYAMNVTDVDDKIIAKSKATNRTIQSISQQYENEFFQDLKLIGVERPTVVPRATEYIQEMIQFISRLHRKGFAYRTSDGSVYLDTIKAKDAIGYPGPLGGKREIALCTEEPGQDKRNPSDFALWKGSAEQIKSNDNWDARPVGGYGRPGWHLECSAMVDATLGRVRGDGRIDMHGGGIDLCFPHHTNERCQSQLLLVEEGGGGNAQREWATIFCHTGHVTVDQTKMSKSLGNFSTIRGVLQSGQLTPRQLRLLFLYSSKYSSGLEWNTGCVERVRALDVQLDAAMRPVARSASVQSFGKEALSDDDIRFIHTLAEVRESVDVAFADDFDFPKVFDGLQIVAKELIKRSTTSTSVNSLDAQARKYVGSTLSILGFGGDDNGVLPSFGQSPSSSTGADKDETITNAAIDELVRFRAKVRTAAKSGDVKGVLQACDALRNDNPLATIQDLKDGSSVWKRKQ